MKQIKANNSFLSFIHDSFHFVITKFYQLKMESENMLQPEPNTNKRNKSNNREKNRRKLKTKWRILDMIDSCQSIDSLIRFESKQMKFLWQPLVDYIETVNFPVQSNKMTANKTIERNNRRMRRWVTTTKTELKTLASVTTKFPFFFNDFFFHYLCHVENGI